ncbi:hypothetical protein MAUB_18790 [Mycolicibacterium aubagnense]|uniref:GAF domain-containing protein n=1 Tax=Mycolicibacterium aubagnense TaxID=319707 RepID=A0ABM7IBB2_9MYCO|nr:hypothetical protein MAUB_18790 [Mycolicibacterium aubagnense]
MTALPGNPVAPQRAAAPDLDQLTGVRSGKGTFYPEFRVAAQRTERVVAALEAISRALVQTVNGPENLVRAVAEAARTHLGAEWVLLALADGALPEARPRHLILDADGHAYSFEGLSGTKHPVPHLPDAVLNRLNDVLRGRLAQFRIPVIESHHSRPHRTRRRRRRGVRGLDATAPPARRHRRGGDAHPGQPDRGRAAEL